MNRKVKFSLVYRDMWQSSGKYMPRKDQLTAIAPHIVEMGCFDRVETNGGGFEQINLLFGENPNQSVREWTQAFNDAGIQTHMLERGLNALRMTPVPLDVRRLMFKVKKKQGTDIARSFDGLNDERNVIDSIILAKEGGMIAQPCLCLAFSKVHTVEYFSNLAQKFIDAGADEICLKDMAGIVRPAWLGKIVKNIKATNPDIPIEYHGHAAPGFAMATILEVVREGVEYVDVGMEPLSWGTGHPDLLAVHAMLDDAGFDVPDINMSAYMKVRAMTTEFINDFLGYYINPKNRNMNSLLIKPGLPGGMMGSLMSDLEQNLISLNKWLEKRNKQTLTIDELLIKLFDEVEYIWPKVGYPPLVTPYSQYVKNLAVMNVMQMEKGKERWSLIADNIWDMLLGKSGKLPGELCEELKEKAKNENKTLFDGDPKSLYEDELNLYEQELNDNNWERGQDDEELLELAMHPQQYRAYKSGEAKENFEKDLDEKRKSGAGIIASTNQKTNTEQNGKLNITNGNQSANNLMPTTMYVDVEGEKYKVEVSYDSNNSNNTPLEKNNSMLQNEATNHLPTDKITYHQPQPNGTANGTSILSPLEGKFYLTKDNNETPIKVGNNVNEGDVLCYIESMKTFNAVIAEKSGVVQEILVTPGNSVDEDDPLVVIQ